jgi:hypothetical protein
MAPWGRISLDVEQLRIAQATRAIEKYPVDLKIVGAHVDGVFVLVHTFEATAIYNSILDDHKFPDGAPMFHIKNEPVCKVPTWPLGDVERSHLLDFAKHQWNTLQEWDVPDANLPTLL